MENLLLSKNGLYLISENKIFFANNNTSYDINHISNNKWINILKENTTYCLQKKLATINEIAAFHRKITYQLFENISFDNKSKIILEYEIKFGNKLITESYQLAENIFGDAWNWLGDKLNEFGSDAVELGKNFVNCLSGNCSPFFEKFRDLLYNPVGIAIETFFTIAFPGAGNLSYMIIWSIMLLYDGYLLTTNNEKFSWWNIIFDIIGIIFSNIGAKAARTAVGGTEAISKSVGKSLEEVIQDAMKNPKIAGYLKQAGKYMNKISSGLKSALTFMSEKMGLKWVKSAFSAIENSVAKLTQLLGASEKVSSAAGKAAKTGAEAKTIQAVASKTAGAFMKDPYDEIIDLGNKSNLNADALFN